MKHLLVRVADFQNVAPYTLRVTFDDGTAQTIDFEPVLYVTGIHLMFNGELDGFAYGGSSPALQLDGRWDN